MLKKIFIIIVSTISLIFSKESIDYSQKFNFSTGVFNERLAYNLVNFSYDLYNYQNNEFFASVGHASILIWTVGFGWKRYFPLNKNKKVTPFLSLSIYERRGNRMAVVNGSSIRVDECINFSTGISIHVVEIKQIDMDLYFQLGALIANDFRNAVDEIAFMNFEFRF